MRRRPPVASFTLSVIVSMMSEPSESELFPRLLLVPGKLLIFVGTSTGSLPTKTFTIEDRLANPMIGVILRFPRARLEAAAVGLA